MNWLAIFIIICGIIESAGLVGNIPNYMNRIKLRKGINMCTNNNFEKCQYITHIVPIVPNKTKISYITNNINYEMVVSIYTTYNNKNNLMFLNNGTYLEIYNKTISYDNEKIQHINIVSKAFYNRIIEYIYKLNKDTDIMIDMDNGNNNTYDSNISNISNITNLTKYEK